MSLPNAYQEVEYIESSGTQWINTWVTPTSNTKSQIKFRNLVVTWATIYWMCYNDNTDYRIFNYNSQIYFDFNSSRVYWSTCTANVDYEFEVWNYYVKNVWASSNLISWNTISWYTWGYTIKLNYNDNDWSISSNRRYYVKIWDWNTQVRDLVPCYRKSDSVIWLYDLINDVFYTNSWTGTFTKWPDVIAEWYVVSRILWWGPGEYYNQWPCPDWFHVPTSIEMSYIWNMLQTYTGSSSYSNLLSIYKMPLAWMWEDWWWTYWMWSAANYYTCSTSWANAIRFFYNSSGVSPTATINREYAFPIRAFKNEPVEPNWSWWTRIAVWDVTAHWEWIWRNSDLWLITIVEYSTWRHYYTTIADKNVWATTVYSSWATLSQNNCWNYFQWWNNYWFPFSGTITTSSTKIDASDYWPTNPYESSTFITWWWDWSTVQNDNLWWKNNAGTAINKQRLIWGTEPPPPPTPVLFEIETDFRNYSNISDVYALWWWAWAKGSMSPAVNTSYWFYCSNYTSAWWWCWLYYDISSYMSNAKKITMNLTWTLPAATYQGNESLRLTDTTVLDSTGSDTAPNRLYTNIKWWPYNDVTCIWKRLSWTWSKLYEYWSSTYNWDTDMTWEINLETWVITCTFTQPASISMTYTLTSSELSWVKSTLRYAAFNFTTYTTWLNDTIKTAHIIIE